MKKSVSDAQFAAVISKRFQFSAKMMFCSVKNATKQSLYQNVPNVTDILQRYGIIVKVIN